MNIRVPKRVPVVILSGECEGMFTETEDISLGGVSIMMERLLKIGTEVVLQFHLPTTGMPIEVKCQVTGCSEAKVGFQFVGLSPEVELEIWNYIISNYE